MTGICKLCLRKWSILIVFCTVIGIFASNANADLFINILAVNGTNSEKESDIRQLLPPELTAEDIVDTGGLKLDYDVNAESYYVHGKVVLAAKETKSYKILVKDVWEVSPDDVEGLRKQIDEGYNRVKDTADAEVGGVRKEHLLERLNFIVSQQSELENDIEKRIDHYRIYSKELSQIRNNALSPKFWRTKPATLDKNKVINLIIELKNPSDKDPKKVEQSHYLPGEVKPEHIIENPGFDIRYDVEKDQIYLKKEEELAASEEKRYRVGIVDVWHVSQVDIDNLKERTRKVYKLLENTNYAESAETLVKNIKENLERIEASQAQEKEIKAHISSFRVNKRYYDKAEQDILTLEDWLEAVRENLERSILRNVLQKIRSLKDIADIAESLLGRKPAANNAWRIITGIVIFVGLLTFIHFAVWGKRASAVRKKEDEEKEEEQEEKKEKEEA